MKTTHFVKIFSILIVLCLLPASVLAVDFGLVTRVHGGYGNPGSEENKTDFKADLWPRFSAFIGDNAELLVTAGITFNMDDKFIPIPELLHTEFSMLFGSSGIRVGRINYSDPLTFITEGIFDGALYFYNSDIGNFSFGVWYTGFLYKNNANIAMTFAEQQSLSIPFFYEDFLDTYFAPSRLFSAADWEHPSIAELVHLNAAVICQIDLTDSERKYHNQYLIVKAGVPVNNLLFELGCAIELSQTVTEENKFNMSFAGEAGVFWLFPGNFNSRLSLAGKIAGGGVNEFISAFTPITSKYYGFILKHKLSGLSIFTLDYSSRINESLSASANMSYFVRNDMGAFQGYPVSEGSKGYFLGPELFAEATWNPASDLQINFGAGAFLPYFGDAGPKQKMHWRADLTVTMALY